MIKATKYSTWERKSVIDMDRAAGNGNLEAVQKMLDQGCNFRAADDRALRHAAHNGHAATVTWR